MSTHKRHDGRSRVMVGSVVAAIVAVLAIVVLPAPFAVAADSAGQVSSVRNTVVIVRNGAKIAAVPGMLLSAQDIVQTGEKSRAKLAFSDDSILTLGEKSQVQVKEYLYSPESKRSKAIYELLDGALKVVVGRSDLEVHSETAVAAARGTEYFVQLRVINGRIHSIVAVVDGVVTVHNINRGVAGAVRIGAGRMTSVGHGRAPHSSMPIPPDLLQLLEALAARNIDGQGIVDVTVDAGNLQELFEMLEYAAMQFNSGLLGPRGGGEGGGGKIGDDNQGGGNFGTGGGGTKPASPFQRSR